MEPVPVPGLKPPPAAPAKQEGVKEAPPKKSLASAFGQFAQKPPEEVEGVKDGDIHGDSAVQEGERYFGALKAAIRRYYDVSSTISEQERMYLRAEVAIRIGARGELLDVRIAKSSGNDLFDASVVSAAKKASPFGPPPDHLRPELSGRGIILEFTP
ncbi:MAG: TonB C-terminal domain-containing protein [Myxococcaceae bacterium]|nr:TonB C-terminal domain-containing protein [Myxococcaceae bacterium]